MSRNALEIWQNAIELNRSWEVLSDHGMPGFNYRDHLKKLRNFDNVKTDDEYNRQGLLLKDKEKKLKIQMLFRIVDGEFDAYGRNITQSADGSIVKIPNSLFDPMATDFEVEWDADRLVVRGILFVDIRLVPCLDGAETATMSVKSPKSTNSNNSAGQIKRGRRSEADIIIKSIRECYKNHPEIENLKQDSQIPYFRDWIRQIYCNINPDGERFSDKTFKKYIAQLKIEVSSE